MKFKFESVKFIKIGIIIVLFDYWHNVGVEKFEAMNEKAVENKDYKSARQ